ncbi:MAG: ThiF family adenylyltransferase [Prolixibacteraceae bacterium]|nr:ThiF family adenylyltransferase [Prolixibacteraceae bacterium]
MEFQASICTAMNWNERTSLLLGNEKMEKLRNASVLVVGLGGVGAYAAEMLCRAGIGHLAIVDGDVVEKTNRNRQLPALVSTTGKSKTEILKHRFLDINPELKITATNSFLRDEQTVEMLQSRNFDYVEMLGGVENFCFRHAIEKKTAHKLQLLAEELVINIVAPKYGACSLNLSFSEKLGTYELSVSYGGEKFDALENAEDDLSAMMVKKSTKSLQHKYDEGKNIITAEVGVLN